MLTFNRRDDLPNDDFEKTMTWKTMTLKNDDLTNDDFEKNKAVHL